MFAAFIKKTRINEMLDQSSLKILEEFMYQSEVDKVKELLENKLPTQTRNTFIRRAVDWIKGRDFEDPEVGELTGPNR